ncbi:STY0301 family protein [uncultured Sphingomonas sp.]|uniref:STY0301 family protein n=1 Tax=uncultured Sphingomonas sp. TaxID=158754 RepID=UPI0030F765B6
MIGIVAIAAAVTATCPTQRRGAPLHSVDIYDGSITDNAVLAPDATRRLNRTTMQVWRVEGVYRAGRSLNVRCGYAAGGSVMMPVTRPVRECHLSRRAGVRTFHCA